MTRFPATHPWIDEKKAKSALIKFFDDEREDLAVFGRTINQVFEAFVFAKVIQWYRDHDWTTRIRNPWIRVKRDDGSYKDAEGPLKLKFSTRGRPSNYSYAECTKDDQTIEIRHQLRVQTRAARYRLRQFRTRPACNICLDVAVIRDVDMVDFNTDDSVHNDRLVTFGEAKHMSGFAELIASFIGIVHEMQPERLRQVRIKGAPSPSHPPPFLFLSGIFYRTGEAVFESVEQRKYDVDVFTRTDAMSKSWGTDILTRRPTKITNSFHDALDEEFEDSDAATDTHEGTPISDDEVTW